MAKIQSVNVIKAYSDAFSKRYPAVKLEVKVKKVKGDVLYSVGINGTDDGRLLTLDELQSATADFLR